MPNYTFTPEGGTEIDLGKYSPRLRSQIAGRWGRHPIPGQRGDLKEDLGDGSLMTTVPLEFVGRTQPDYYVVIPALSKTRRGVFLHPRRGSRQSVITAIREEIDYSTKGDSTLVELDIEDAVIGQADNFKAGPSARRQNVEAQSRAADDAMSALLSTVFARPALQPRVFAREAAVLVSASTAAARTYAAAAQDAFSLGVYGPSIQAQLKALPAQVQGSLQALRLVGPAADIQDTVLALEAMLFAATQLDIAIRAAQPVPIETRITRQPGQSLYAFVQQHYQRSGKTAADMRNLVGLIRRLNPQIRRPSLIVAGTVVVRPAA